MEKESERERERERERETKTRTNAKHLWLGGGGVEAKHMKHFNTAVPCNQSIG